MSDIFDSRKQALLDLIQQNGWGIMRDKPVDYGHQYVLTNGKDSVPINIYTTGKINVQGKTCEMKTQLQEWANLELSGVGKAQAAVVQEVLPNRIAKYMVIPTNRKFIKGEVVNHLPGNVEYKEIKGVAEEYRAEVHYSKWRVTITQYESGTLMVQGLSTPLFDQVCEVLDQHLAQEFSDRATRFIPGAQERSIVRTYLESSDAENEAASWLLRQLEQSVLEFLYPNDRQTLLAAAGVRNAICSTQQALPDFSVVVMPFAKAYEGFVARLAVHLRIAEEDVLKEKADAIQIGGWLDIIEVRLPDKKRYGEIVVALKSAWGCRHKVIHSDFAHPLSTLNTFEEAEQDISVILRAIRRAYQVFVTEALALLPERTNEALSPPTPKEELKLQGIDRDALCKRLLADGVQVQVQPDGRKNLWELYTNDLVLVAPRAQDVLIVRGTNAEVFCEQYKVFLQPGPCQKSHQLVGVIGVDESGKGDVFGPLVVAGAVVTAELEIELAKRGVRDSKTLSDAVILELDKVIQSQCPVEVLVLLPSHYNEAYEAHGQNLNKLLAWGHAQVINSLHQQTGADKAISDQFGDKALLENALLAQQCKIELVQRPKAESEIAVAAASIVARAAFRRAMNKYNEDLAIDIPLGASSPQVKEVGRQILRRWGQKGLTQVAKMHFKTIREIMEEERR